MVLACGTDLDGEPRRMELQLTREKISAELRMVARQHVPGDEWVLELQGHVG